MTPYGCHNTARQASYYALNGYYVKSYHPHEIKERRVLVALVPDRSSEDCQYRKTTTDPRCEGCEK